MAHANKLTRSILLSGGSAKSFQRRHIYLPAFLLFSLVLVGAAGSSGQDLGAAAREERARKQAQPVHQTHVYTNDDLARHQILTPKDDAEFKGAQKSWRAASVDTPPAGPEAAAVPLGEIARQYSELRAIRQQESRPVRQISHSSHVYTNEDMARPQILTPEDHAVFEAAQEKRRAPMEQGPSMILGREPNLPSAPVGAVAKLYRQQKPVAEMQKQRGAHFPSGTPLLAPPRLAGGPTALPPGTGLIRQPIQSMRWDQLLGKPGGSVGRLLTVKPGDSLWRLARQFLGRGQMWRALWKASPWIHDPNHLKVGVQIRIQSRPFLPQSAGFDRLGAFPAQTSVPVQQHTTKDARVHLFKHLLEIDSGRGEMSRTLEFP